MTRKILTVALWGLASIGAMALVAIATLWYFTLGPGNSPRHEAAKPQDVAFILNWAGLGSRKIESVVNSYESSRSLMGDHLDAYEIKLTQLDVTDVLEKADGSLRWYRGDQLPQVVVDAIQFAAPYGEAKWFPSPSELLSEDTWVLPRQITLYGMTIQQTQLIFVQPSKKLVFYVEQKI